MPEKRSGESNPASGTDTLPPDVDRKRLRIHESPAQCSTGSSTKTRHGLCHDCAQIDLNNIISRPSPRLGNSFGSVGQRFRAEMTDHDCLLCPMLHRSRISKEQIDHFQPNLDFDRYDALYGRDAQDGTDELVACPFLRNTLQATRKWSTHKDQRTTMSKVLVIIPAVSSLDTYNRLPYVIKEYIQTRECAVIQHDVAGRMFLARQPSTRFDPRQVMSWIEYCECNHKTLCLPSSCEAHGIQLLNCNTLFVERATVERRYVALSYVWGQSTPVEDYIGLDNRGLRIVPSASPKVISDAISVTKLLGYQYLWIDKLCIDQQDATDKHRQIEQMDIIYERAQLTIIAAAGQDENHGLPGVTSNRFPWLENVQIREDLNIVWTAKDPHCAIRQSVWSSRGWTFQEAVLTRRRLVFLEDQVYFECNAMNCCESLTSPLDSLHVQSKTQMDDVFRAGVFDRNEHMRFGHFDRDSMSLHELFAWYLSSIEEYTARNLRFDSDSYTAFAGIMRRFAKRKHPIYEVCGLPYLDVDENDASIASFPHSLMWVHAVNCWDGSKNTRRRPDFPSWTWAGWSGRVKYHQGESASSLRRLEFVNSTTIEVTSLALLDSITDYRPSPYTILRIEAVVIPVSMIRYESDPGADGSGSWAIDFQAARYVADLHLSQDASSESDFAQDLGANKGDRWRCALIGYVGEFSGVMILKKDEKANRWTRAGLFFVYDTGPFMRDTALLVDGTEVFEIE